MNTTNLGDLPECPLTTAISPTWSWPMVRNLLGRLWDVIRTERQHRRRMLRRNEQCAATAYCPPEPQKPNQ